MTFRLAGSGSIIGLAALVIICPGRAESDGTANRAAGWARVESLQPGTPTRLILFKSAVSQESRKIKGAFTSATDASVTIMPKSGRTRTVQRQSIQAIRVSRVARRRYGWIPGVAVFSVTLASMLAHPGRGDWEPGAFVGIPAVISAPAGILGYLLIPSTRLVYRAQQVSRS